MYSVSIGDVHAEDEAACLGIVAVVHAAQGLGVVALVSGDGEEVSALEVEAALLEADGAHPFLRQRIAYLQVLEAEVRSTLQEPVGYIVVDGVLGVGYGTVGIVRCPCIGHDGRKYGSRAVALKTVTHLVVYLVAAHALEEDGEVYSLPLGADGQTVVEPWNRAAEFHAVLVVDAAVAAVVAVFRVAGVEGDVGRGISLQVVQGLLIGLIDAFVVVAPEVIEGISLVYNLDVVVVGIYGRTSVQGRQLVVDERHVAVDPIVDVPNPVAVLQGDLDTLVAHLAHIGGGRIAVTHVCRSRHAHQHVVGVADEAFDRTGQLVLEESEVDADAPLLGVLPMAAVVDPGQHSGAVGQLLVLAEHIDLIKLNPPFTNLLSSTNRYGAGYMSLLQGKSLYLGTNQGLFLTDYPCNGPNVPDLAPIIRGQIWDVSAIIAVR